jgi:hypothetical protein
MAMTTTILSLLLVSALACVAVAEPILQGEVVDAAGGAALPARVYIQASDGRWFFVKSASPQGTAVAYSKSRGPRSVEMHTTLSAHPFVVQLPPGRYSVRVERGTEYLPAERTVDIGREPVHLKIPLARWIDMAAAGWYSGDTHVHRSMEELPNLLLAEDLNVALPLTYWVTKAYTAPQQAGPKGPPQVRPEPIAVDRTHVIYPVNTEYEIFQVGDKSHTLGAVFVLGHKAALTEGVPPVGRIAAQARREGGLLDLDKHSWPWSLMLVPVMSVDLFELANNHVWRTEFGLPQWTLDTAPAYMKLQQDARGFTEWGWIDYGFQTYYALLDCGFRLRPAAGTASGVHPVPLGFGRVYVNLPDGFSYDRWMRGLQQGRSFVTTGPMLMVEVDQQPPGAAIRRQNAEKRLHRVSGLAVGSRPLGPLEIVVNGQVVQRVAADNCPTKAGGYESRLSADVELDGSGWIAVRVLEDRPDRRIRFAHSSPVHIDVPGRPLRPRRQEAEFLVRRMKEELARNQGVLPPESLQEYRQALAVYEEIAEKAR